MGKREKAAIKAGHRTKTDTRQYCVFDKTKKTYLQLEIPYAVISLICQAGWKIGLLLQKLQVCMS